MIKNNILGIIFANVHDQLVPELTKKRSMASIPFGSRYRLIDFSLSNLVNAGISKVGIITKSNYNSLLDHLGSGISWDLDRKNGGLFILPPFSTSKAGIFKGHVDALAGIMTFLKRSHEEYVVMCDADVVSNMDIDMLINKHITSDADVTIAYKHGLLADENRNTMELKIGGDGFVENIVLADKQPGEIDYSLDVFVIKREKLIELISNASKNSLTSLSKEVLIPNLHQLKILAVKIDTFAEVVYNTKSYAKISMSLLNKEARENLFNPERPVYTKTRDDMPSRYGLKSDVTNSLIGSGSIIDGSVKNSILFRSVTVGKGAKIENCIIMQGTKIGENCVLKNVIIDKSATISDGVTLMGGADNYVFVDKGKTI
ncbi:MAG: glucose-1-phosphate adenylyltransferase subunit GlgD [Clostridia bacterium]|nr:glucose-1-phosphate adenylyltransferase subunit GlgD [Clostridia bacterium]